MSSLVTIFQTTWPIPASVRLRELYGQCQGSSWEPESAQTAWPSPALFERDNVFYHSRSELLQPIDCLFFSPA